MFAFSSIIGNYYYGQANIEYLTENKFIMFIFRLLVVEWCRWFSCTSTNCLGYCRFIYGINGGY